MGETATQQEVRKAYHKLALRLHPDKNKDDQVHPLLFLECLCFDLFVYSSGLNKQEAKENFQQLQKVISILGDEEKRAVYDQTGSVDDAVSWILYDFYFQLFCYYPWY